jgi:hypothetical protein
MRRACKDPHCVAFAKREPGFDRRLRRANIVAHYIGKTTFGETWMLDGITPVTRQDLDGLLVQRAPS